jgi:DNA polymerase I-like protein with 3'-5' exonuclease and polymerase domains
VSGRASHSKPNLAQIPTHGSLYGKEFRSLFTVPDWCKLVGVDLKSAELRVLAGYLKKYDGGKYIDIVLNQDVHQANADALGISRSQAKRAVYCWLYGGSAQLLGEVVGGGAKEGKALQARWYEKMPALKRFKQAVVTSAKRGHLFGLDKRRLPVRSSHSAVNLLLQSGAALLTKQAVVSLHKDLSPRLTYGVDWAMVAQVHDELQLEVAEQHAEDVAKAAVHAVEISSEAFGFPCPMAADSSIGNTWAETH